MPSDLITVATSKTKIVSADGARIVLTIQNVDDASYVDISDDSSRGPRLYPHQKITICKVDGDEPEKQWVGYAEAALTVKVHETFDKTYKRPQDPERAKTRATESGVKTSHAIPAASYGGRPP